LKKGLGDYAADEIAKSVWEQLPNPNIRNCVQIGRLVKNEPYIEMAIADELQRIWYATIGKEYRPLNCRLSTFFLQAADFCLEGARRETNTVI
jgi:hypothetical protein